MFLYLYIAYSACLPFSQVWDALTGQLQRLVSKNNVTSCAFHPLLRLVVLGFTKGFIEILRLKPAVGEVVL